MPSGRGTIPRYIIATVFLAQHDKIFSVDSALENQIYSVTSGESQVLSSEQNQNRVAILLIGFPIAKVSKQHECSHRNCV